MIKDLKEEIKFNLFRGYLELKTFFDSGVALVRAESPEEQAKAQKVLAGCIIGGLIMLLATNIAAFLGLDYTKIFAGTDVNNKAIRDNFAKLETLLRGIGAFVLVVGIIYGGIQLIRKK